ncbi:WXG100 family type VII secretion target [Planosporangium flavigriseum]|uniref:WXG100 family type VII secretion target n=1 Tax=Planosporangium flavigriseum TaxID=373681 RepID=A0A8J3LJQ2_9ACTN|nr:WXG100 family type VII secretion target [Planosporangium flavigriseum]NJC63105.1 WXG100 family type VII secretion target [Planosporangium flavigriseum]GIG74483.1 hypothetical protein Pfl04_28870 [Planosporangium flavigriseum]
MRTTSLLHGGDPCPGDPAGVHQVVGQLRAAAENVSDAATLIRRVASDTTMWTGAAADAFAQRHDELIRQLSRARAAYESAADALGSWVRQLEHAQAEAASIVYRAQAAAQAAAAQAGTHHLVGARPPALAALQKARDALEHRAQQDAKRCAQALDEASQQFGNVHHDLGRWVAHAWEDVLTEAAAASKMLHVVDDVVGIVALVTGPIPVVGQVVGAVALLALAATVVCDVTLAASGRQSWWIVAEDGVSIAFAGAGKVAGRVLREAKAAEQFGASARSASRLGGGFTRSLRPAEARLATGQGSINEVKLWAGARRAALGDAAELRALARNAQAHAEVRDAIRAVLRNPLAELASGEKEALAGAKAFKQLPLLSQWTPQGTRQAVSMGVYDGLNVKDGKEAIDTLRKIDIWVNCELTGQPVPDWDSM